MVNYYITLGMCIFLRGEKCLVCGKTGEKHHIIFKSEKGIEFTLNYIYLCSEHHRGKNGPHRNRKIDLTYKLQLQEKLGEILSKEYYSIDELTKLLELNNSQAKTIFKNFKSYKEGYRKTDIIKHLMGGRLYFEVMLDDYYDSSWNINENFESDYFEIKKKIL